MRDFIKLFIVGIVIFFAPQVFAESYKVLVLPDNIVTDNVALDSYIYNATSEFFADEIITILNETDNIKCPNVSDIRTAYKKDPSEMLAAKDLTSKFRSSYNVDYGTLKKLAQKANSRYALLITSYIDSENYILRRTVWDFLNIPGATVVDPAYKISTYAVLVDTKTNQKLWSDTYYKTISVCENRIITRGQSPQTEQLQKIKDYSRLLCPQIAQNVQVRILPDDVYAKESKQVSYDLGNLDNVFTKKYRYWRSETGKEYKRKKERMQERHEANSQKKLENQQAIETAKEAEAQLEVKAQPIDENIKKGMSEISNKVTKSNSEVTTKTKEAVNVVKTNNEGIKNYNDTKTTDKKKDNPFVETQSINYYGDINNLEIKRKKKNFLDNTPTNNRPALRDYYN